MPNGNAKIRANQRKSRYNGIAVGVGADAPSGTLDISVFKHRAIIVLSKRSRSLPAENKQYSLWKLESLYVCINFIFVCIIQGKVGKVFHIVASI